MQQSLLPEQLLPANAVKPKVTFVPYASATPAEKGKSRLTQHMISLITQGEKLIYADDTPIHITPAQIMLLSGGNYLFTERVKPNEMIKSTMIFFDSAFLTDALNANTHIKKSTAQKKSFALFDRDDYLKQFVQSVEDLLTAAIFTQPMQVAKLNELLAYLCAKYPEVLDHFQEASFTKTPEQRIKNVCEQNVLNNLSVSELAFLCHMSLPTFKRKFQQLYNLPPAKWMQQQRLTTAANLLRSGTKPSDVYLQVGYENHSSFSEAFKVQFGQLPKEYA